MEWGKGSQWCCLHRWWQKEWVFCLNDCFCFCFCFSDFQMKQPLFYVFLTQNFYCLYFKYYFCFTTRNLSLDLSYFVFISHFSIWIFLFVVFCFVFSLKKILWSSILCIYMIFFFLVVILFFLHLVQSVFKRRIYFFECAHRVKAMR